MSIQYDTSATVAGGPGPLIGTRDPSIPLARNTHLLNWVEKMANLTTPDAIHWVDGSQEEYEALCAQMVAGGTFIKLNEELWPGCYYARSDASDVARVEDRTFICSLSKDGAGPTNNWEEPFKMRRKLKELFQGSIRTSASCRVCIQWARRWPRVKRMCPGRVTRKSTSSTFRKHARSGRTA